MLALFSTVVACLAFFPGLAGAASIGVVDVNKVTGDSVYFKTQLDAFDKFQQEKETALDAQLGSLLPGMLLTPTELDNYRQLLAKTQPSAQDQQAMQALQGVSSSRQQELAGLRNPPVNLTPQQQARLTELSPLYDAALQRQTESQQMVDAAQKEIDAKQEEVMNSLWKSLTDAISLVAQREKLECVFQKSAVFHTGQASQEMLFCLYVDPGSDMTDAIIKAIDEANPVPAEAPKQP